jgi:hypothetical protein
VNRLHCVHGRNGRDNTQCPISFTTLTVIYKGERRVVQVRVVLKQTFFEKKKKKKSWVVKEGGYFTQ